MPNIIVAALVVVTMFFASKYVRQGIHKLVSRFSSKQSITRLIASIVSGVLVFLGMLLVLTILDLKETVTSLLAGAGIVGLVAGLAFQDVLSNTFAGVVLTVKSQFRIGDHVHVNDIEGILTKIGFRFSLVRTFQGQIITVPNRILVNNPVRNFTLPGERRVDLTCGVSYNDDLEKVQEVALNAICKQVNCDPEKEVRFFYTGFGDSSINFVVQYWLDNSKRNIDFLKERSQGIISLKKAFDKHGIDIPFPIRTLNLPQEKPGDQHSWLSILKESEPANSN